MLYGQKNYFQGGRKWSETIRTVSLSLWSSFFLFLMLEIRCLILNSDRLWILVSSLCPQIPQQICFWNLYLLVDICRIFSSIVFCISTDEKLQETATKNWFEVSSCTWFVTTVVTYHWNNGFELCWNIFTYISREKLCDSFCGKLGNLKCTSKDSSLPIPNENNICANK